MTGLVAERGTGDCDIIDKLGLGPVGVGTKGLDMGTVALTLESMRAGGFIEG
jgi:hypothetical protein